MNTTPAQSQRQSLRAHPADTIPTITIAAVTVWAGATDRPLIAYPGFVLTLILTAVTLSATVSLAQIPRRDDQEDIPARLLPSVVAALTEAGLTVEEYARHHCYEDGWWGGDRCGCPDDRCIGFHHFGEDDCGCFPVMLAELQAVRDDATGGAR
jgi:hypothetical protein